MKNKLTPYLPGLLLFLVALVVGLATYQDYGMCWDEPMQRDPGLMSFNYIFHNNQDLFKKESDNHGAGFELLLVFLEKGLKLSDSRDIYMMRHLVTHLLFLVSALAGYVLVYRLLKNRFLASIFFLMMVLAPRMYAHSFFNSKDLPFLSMIVITFALAQWAFEKNKFLPFLLLGLVCGYGTSIRIMGILIYGTLFAFLAADAFFNYRDKKPNKQLLVNTGAFSVGFLVLLYAAWPYLWKAPVEKFVESFAKMSHFNWSGAVLFQGAMLSSDKPLPLSYFPTWFFISNPVLWLIIGFAGIAWILKDFFKQPIQFLQNTPERHFLLYGVAFIGPIFAVMILHSVIYDDWRHLYFVYPSFLLMGIYAVHKMLEWAKQKKNIQMAIQGACAIQLGSTALFMVQNHPHHQVYFNTLVSHDDEYLRKNYDLEYWGCTFKQALEHLVENDPKKVIKVCCIYKPPLDNNIMMLPPEQRGRIEFVEQSNLADYFITNFRLHPEDFPSNNIEHEIVVLNSTIMRIYRMH